MQYCKRRRMNLGMAWIDYHKAYDLIPHSWTMDYANIQGSE